MNVLSNTSSFNYGTNCVLVIKSAALYKFYISEQKCMKPPIFILPFRCWFYNISCFYICVDSHFFGCSYYIPDSFLIWASTKFVRQRETRSLNRNNVWLCTYSYSCFVNCELLNAMRSLLFVDNYWKVDMCLLKAQLIF